MGKFSDCWTYPKEVIDELIAKVVPITRTVNGKALDQNVTITPSDIGAVPTTRKINNKALSSNVTLTASDVGAVPTSDLPEIYINKGDMGVAPNTSRDFNDYVNTGTYFNNGTNREGSANVPHIADNGYLIVNYGNGNVMQIWVGAFAATLKVRKKIDNTWSAWTTLF